MVARSLRTGGENGMVFTLACNAFPSTPNCPYVARGETMDAMMADMTNHAKSVHGYTDEQLKDPKMMEAVKAKLKQE
jgi:predicted small metal-binding protein